MFKNKIYKIIYKIYKIKIKKKNKRRFSLIGKSYKNNNNKIVI